MKSWAFRHGYPCDIQEDKGFLESLFMVRVTVPDNEYQQAHAQLKTWLNSVNNRGAE